MRLSESILRKIIQNVISESVEADGSFVWNDIEQEKEQEKLALGDASLDVWSEYTKNIYRYSYNPETEEIKILNPRKITVKKGTGPYSAILQQFKNNESKITGRSSESPPSQTMGFNEYLVSKITSDIILCGFRAYDHLAAFIDLGIEGVFGDEIQRNLTRAYPNPTNDSLSDVSPFNSVDIKRIKNAEDYNLLNLYKGIKFPRGGKSRFLNLSNLIETLSVRISEAISGTYNDPISAEDIAKSIYDPALHKEDPRSENTYSEILEAARQTATRIDYELARLSDLSSEEKQIRYGGITVSPIEKKEALRRLSANSIFDLRVPPTTV